MFLNYLLVALYILKRQPGFSLVKILSLAIGLGCSMLVIMHVQYWHSFDRHFPGGENIYRVVTGLTTDQRIEFEGSSDAVAPQMKIDYPQIEAIAKIRPSRGLFSRGNDNSSANDYHFAEPDLIRIFSLQFKSGDPATALNEPNSVVLSETAAAKYFPGEDPLGQVLTLEDPLKLALRVTGVMRNLPQNTHMKLQILISVATGRQIGGPDFMGGDAWIGFGGTQTYLKLPNKAEANTIISDLPAFLQRNMPESLRTFANNSQLTLGLQPLFDIYLDKRGSFGSSNKRPEILLTLGIFATLILITSCINFANLSLSQTQQRCKEIGVRKTLGAKRRQIVVQFLFESLLLTAIALLLVIPSIYFLLPVYANLTNADFTPASALKAGGLWSLPVFVVVTGALSGLLPALALSRYEPASIIKGLTVRVGLSSKLRSLITIVQFGFSTALILLALAITLQIRHLNTMDIGFDKNNLVVMDSTYSFREPKAFDYTAMVDELWEIPGILGLAQTSAPPPVTGSYGPWRLPTFGPDEFRSVSAIVVDPGFLDVMRLKLIAGRWFSRDFPGDFMLPPAPDATPPVRGVVITRQAVSNFGFNSPEDALDKIMTPGAQEDYRVIGVVEDFRQSGGLEDTRRSTSVMRSTLDPQRILLIRIDPAQMETAIRSIDEIWKRHRPSIPVNRTFFDQTFNDLVYAQTNGISKAAILASVITVLISVMGLYGLAYYSTQRRTKEIGIHKVMGATSMKIVYILTWDFLQPVLVACALATVGGYFAIGRYLEQFSSRVTALVWVYVVVIAVTLLVAVLTVAVHCWRAGNANPVKSLRYE